jgi:DNA-binding LacI/PurR family transcriptional regulator
VVRLTTIRQFVSTHGATAARAVVAQIERGPQPTGADEPWPFDAVVEPIELVVRDSTGPLGVPPTDDGDSAHRGVRHHGVRHHDV